MGISRVDLADLQQTIPVVDQGGLPTPSFLRYLNTVIRSLKNGVNSLIDVQNAVDAANAAVAVAQAAAVTAQASADAAQASADAIVVPPSGTRTISTDTTVTGADGTIFANAAAGPITVTLRLASVADAVTIKKIDASANVVAITAHAGDTVNGGAFFNLTTQYQQATATPDGATSWYA